jgi:oligoribonuclease NrnB/cAMP/cGMP phosphodiesterase (DHH superfamily)
MNNQKIQVITHTDLDGVVSYLVLCWLYGKKLDVLGTTPMKLEQDYDKLVSSGKKWDKLYFLDLDVSKIGEKIDQKSTVILDHHKTNLYQFKYAIARIYNETSCAKLIYDTLFKPLNKTISANQKTLIALADDWDSNTKSTPLSEGLNVVYHSMSDKFNSFVDDYFEGFRPFDKFKQNTITLYKKHRKEYIETLNPFFGEVEFDGQKNVKVGAVFCSKFVQECCDWLLTFHNVDVAIAVLIEQKRIAVRRNINNTQVDVSKFVQRIASGGGHEAAAGGNLTEEFIEFTKMLKPIN